MFPSYTVPFVRRQDASYSPHYSLLIVHGEVSLHTTRIAFFMSNCIWRKSHSSMSVLPVSPSSCHHGSPSTTVADEPGTYVSSLVGGSNCQVAQRRANHRGETVPRMPSGGWLSIPDSWSECSSEKARVHLSHPSAPPPPPHLPFPFPYAAQQSRSQRAAAGVQGETFAREQISQFLQSIPKKEQKTEQTHHLA